MKPGDLKKKLMGKAEPPPGMPIGTVAFGVVQLPNGQYQPTKFVMLKDMELELIALHDAVPYEPLAYEYLSADIIRHYIDKKLEEARR